MNVKEIVKERIKYRHPMLHFTECDSKNSGKPFPDVPWHWHEDFEISFIKSGKVLYRTVSKEFLLEPGDGVFINSRVIHAVIPVEPREELHHISQFFDNYFISGGEGNIIDTKYVIPLQKNEEIDIIIFRAGDERFDCFRQILDENSVLLSESKKYFEFELRKNVCDLWRIMLDSVEGLNCDMSISPLANQRLRKAITFIQKHYKEKITLDDIAEFVHISIRECNRMFKKYLAVSPMSYLQAVRLQKATTMLTDTNKSIAEIALENGYTSSSHFGKKFKEHHHITPKEYRDNLKIEENK